MKLCIVSEYFDETGSTPTILTELTTYLREAHPQLAVDVITSRNAYRGEQTLESRVTPSGINIIRLDTPKSNTQSIARRLMTGMRFTLAALRHLLTAERYDLVLVVTNPPSAPLAAKALSAIRGTPYVYLIHDLYPDVATVLGVLKPRQLAARALTSVQRSWLRSAARVVVLGRCMRAHLEQRYGLPASHIEVITNWSDPLAFSGAGTSSFRTANKIDGVVVLYSGNFGHYQDFDDVLDAAALLRDSEPAIRFVLVGGGAKEAQIRSRVSAENLRNVAVFPFVSHREHPDVLAAADIALVTLARGAEGVGVPSKFYNVLASARPTVAVVEPTSEVALVLAEEECGVQVSHGDPHRLAQVVRELAYNAERRQRLGANARKAMLAKYSLPEVGDRFWKLFVQVAAQQK